MPGQGLRHPPRPLSRDDRRHPPDAARRPGQAQRSRRQPISDRDAGAGRLERAAALLRGRGVAAAQPPAATMSARAQSYAAAVVYPDAPADAWRWHGITLLKAGPRRRSEGGVRPLSDDEARRARRRLGAADDRLRRYDSEASSERCACSPPRCRCRPARRSAAGAAMASATTALVRVQPRERSATAACRVVAAARRGIAIARTCSRTSARSRTGR